MLQTGRKLVLSALVISAPFLYIGFSYLQALSAPMEKAPFVFWTGLDPHTEVFISWVTARETGSFLCYGPDLDHLEHTAWDEAPVTLHRVHLTGLSADTLYYYQTGPTPSVHLEDLSKPRSFRTAPNAKQEFTFTCVSDTQEMSGMGYYNTVASAISRLPDTAFVVNAGDLTQTSDDQTLWNLFFQESTFLDRFPLVPCPGNHDDIDNPDSKYLKYFGVTENGRDVCYAFDWGAARFIIAQIGNRSHVDPAVPRNQAPYRWLEETLAASQSRDYRILIYHIHRTETIAALVEKYNVSLAIHGHAHTYSRYTINQHTYVCLGNGATLQEGRIVKQRHVQKRTNGAGFTQLTINPSGIRLETFKPGMDRMDEVFLRRNADTGLLVAEEPTSGRQES